MEIRMKRVLFALVVVLALAGVTALTLRTSARAEATSDYFATRALEDQALRAQLALAGGIQATDQGDRRPGRELGRGQLGTRALPGRRAAPGRTAARGGAAS